MKNYFLGKLSALNYEMAIHEGNANRRLASKANKILVLPQSEVPEKYQKKFSELISLIQLTFRNLPAPGLQPSKLQKIHNATAVKYIKLLLEIEYELEND